MSIEKQKPVIFLAFANEQEDKNKYLRTLSQEVLHLQDSLDTAVQKEWCELAIRFPATSDTILKTFRRYCDRITVFHFGGHANSYHLLLESLEGHTEKACAQGLAAFLGQQHNLHLVFLNACSTQQHVQALLDAGASVVIATSRGIQDDVATQFAAQFYASLAESATIRRAFEEAAGAVQMTYGSDTRHLLTVEAQETLPYDRLPWELHTREGAEQASLWSLSAAVEDPLFGLPAPRKQDLPKSPFRYLYAFGSKDADVFFGRGRQIRELYDLVTQPDMPPIILFYGQSGVGKSSLLAAGLKPRLETRGRAPYRRRVQEKGLRGTLTEALLPASENVPLADAWLALEEQLSEETQLEEPVPVVVMLDQVEEVFAQPQQDQRQELDQFLVVLKAIFADIDRRPKGRLILGFRKEWLAEIEAEIEEHVGISPSKMRLLPLDHDGIVEAVTGPCRSPRLRAKYRLTVEDRLPETIAGHLGGDPDSPIAPTLQILLTRMWELAQKENPDEPRFTKQLYESLERKGDLLRKFLDEQFECLEEWRPTVIESGLALDVLAFHTTTIGAARQQTWESLQEEYHHLNAESELRPLVQKCKERYLLVDPAQNQRDAAKTTRLAHDTLAPLIRERYELSTKPGQVARRVLESLVVDWEDDKIGTELGERALKVVEDGKGGMRARRGDEERLVKESEKARDRRRRLRRIRWGVGLVAALLVLVAAGIAGWQRLELTEILQAKQRADALALVLRGQWAFEDNPLLGVRLLLEGWKLTAQEERPSVEDAIRDQMQYGRLKTLGQGDVAGIYYLANNSMFIVDRGDAPGELHHTSDGSAKLLPGEVSLVKYSPDPGTALVVVGYEDEPGELRRTADNALIVPLSGEISAVEFSTDRGATYFVVDYEGKPGELRKTGDGSVSATFTGEVSMVQFSPDPAATYLLVGYEGERGELRRTADGSLVAPLTDEVSKAQFSPDPAAEYLVVLYGDLGEHSGEGDFGNYYDNDPPAELRRSDDGSLITTIEHEWFLSISSLTFGPRQTADYLEVEFIEVYPEEVDPDFGFPIDAYAETERELRRTADGSLVSSPESTIEISGTTYQPDPPAAYYVLQPPKGPAELHTADGSVVLLTSTIRNVDFSPAGTYFVVHYDYEFSELRRSEGSLVSVLDLGSLRVRITWLVFSADETYFMFQSCGSPGCFRPELRRTTDGAPVGYLDVALGFENDLSGVVLSPCASYLVAYHPDGNAEAFLLPEAERQSGGEPVIVPERLTFPSKALINNIVFSPNESFSVVYRVDGGSELWQWGDQLRVLTDMGLGLSEHRFGPNHQRLIIRHTDGRAYMLDLDWLRAIEGDLASHSVDELEQIFCCGPLAAGRFEEVRLESELLGNPSQTCQFELPCDELLDED